MFKNHTKQFVALLFCTLFSAPLLGDDLSLLLRAEFEPALTPLCPASRYRDPAELQGLYRSNDFKLLWQQADVRRQLADALANLVDDGLNPAHYLQGWPDGEAPADNLYGQLCQDLLLSHYYLQALQDLLLGRVPLAEQETYWQHADDECPVFAAWLQQHQALLSQPAQALAQARPAHQAYHDLRTAYRQLYLHSTDWTRIPTGPSLRPGETDPRVILLAERLQQLGLYRNEGEGQPASGEHYDDALQNAVREAQKGFGLQVDGIVGPATLEALNRSRQQRLVQLRINLERQRWLQHFYRPDQLLVNIAGGDVRLYQQDNLIWQARVQTGRDDRRTPLLVSTLNRVTLNPSWTVPPTILRQDKLPRIQQDPAFLAEQRLRVLDYQGNELDPASIDWQRPQGIMLRQDPGPANPLGRMAFRFPNPFYVYLHDTPSQHIFARAERSVSSGCVRVENADDLAAAVFASLPAERQAQIARQQASGRTREVSLPKGTRVILAYWTAEVVAGQLRFLPDPYQLDTALISRLDGLL